MNFKPLYAWIVLFPLLVGACGGSKDNPELPPPGPQPENPQPGSNPWEANRGKKVQPSGAGWTSTVIDEGIVYYAFEGTESVSNAPQRIFVTDVDLSKSQYEFKLEYYSGRSTASNVFATKNAIAVINGGYERGSIVIWKDGQKYSTMPDNTISDTGVPNWKSEAAVYMDNKRDVRIEFSGKGMSITQQRNFYMNSKEKTILSSAPMLIDDYEPVGESFCTLHPRQSSSSEDPYTHQNTNTHPRTALAKTEFNHLLMIVVDGRRSNVSRGMSAKELTGFLVKNFNPQYAINLDGGGSSTMCVKGQGDPETHVVNYPTDSDQVKGVPDHTGERSVPTFFYVIKK